MINAACSYSIFCRLLRGTLGPFRGTSGVFRGPSSWRTTQFSSCFYPACLMPTCRGVVGFYLVTPDCLVRIVQIITEHGPFRGHGVLIYYLSKPQPRQQA
ncbi:hypothetical protein CEXT_192981 [Caerostris extrusa]|uniref:Uncharacterized protein n=1 Tax=Caerostris extrusa TaxID=172846 RepID=A0AAV4VJT4_CAEEX|nr:hypothetical protein CEXT_192981 [Caerostris extrusa]